MRAIEKHKPASEGGGVYYEERAYALVTSHGSKDTVEKDVLEWFEQLKDQVRQERFPEHWLAVYQQNFERWKANEAPVVNGTAIRNWPAASVGEIKMLHQLGVQAVEDLAVANAELLGRIGMGGQSLKQRAIDWVTAKTGTGPLIEQLAAMREVNKGQDMTIEELKKQLSILSARLDQREGQIRQSVQEGNPVHFANLEDRLANAQAAADSRDEGDLIDDAIAEA
jgi:hypothetical protein